MVLLGFLMLFFKKLEFSLDVARSFDWAAGPEELSPALKTSILPERTTADSMSFAKPAVLWLNMADIKPLFFQMASRDLP